MADDPPPDGDDGACGSDEPVVALRKRGRAAGLRRAAPAADAGADAGAAAEGGALLAAAARRRRLRGAAGPRAAGPTHHRTPSAAHADLDKLGQEFTAEIERRKRDRTGAAPAGDGPEGGGSGPRRSAGSSTVRVSAAVYETKTHICKPYYQTGYCPYGDACKYAHIREEYASMAQLDRKWERDQQHAAGGGGSDGDNGDDDGAAAAAERCGICDEEWADPVVTRCGHTFCGECALRHHEADPKGLCAECGRATHGVFNRAAQAIRRRELRRAEGRRRERAGRAGGDELPSEDEEAGTAGGARRPHRFEATQWLVPPDASDARTRGRTSWL